MAVRDREDGIRAFVARDIRAAEHEIHAQVLHFRRPRLEMQLEVGTENGVLGIVPTEGMVLIAVPIAALLAAEERQVYATIGHKVEFCPAESAIDTERAVLVEVENESRTKLRVDVANGEIAEVEVRFEADMADAIALEIWVVAGQRPLSQLCAGRGPEAVKMRRVRRL